MSIAERFWSKVDKTEGCWEWTAHLRGGYGHFWVDGRNASAHRYSYIIHHPLTIDLWEHRDICVCHKCDNRKCINPAHLELGSHMYNTKDMMAKGRIARGEKQGASKLTEAQVREIRGRYAAGGITQTQLALEYAMKQATISTIILRQSWKHLE